MESDGSMMVGHLSPSTAYFSDDLPSYFTQAVIYTEAIKSHLSSFSQYSNKNALMLNHNTGSILTSNESLFTETAQLTSLFAFVTPRDDDRVYSSDVTLNDQPYIVAACYSEKINCSFIQMIPADTLRTIPDRFSRFIFLFNTLAILVIALYSAFMYRLVKYPMNDMMKAFAITGSGDFDHTLATDYSSSEYNRLAAHFNDMTKRIKTLIETNFEQKILLQRAELKQLQAQINPHFLYNSFFFLRYMIGQNIDQARVFTAYLGKYFQYITKNDTDLVQLRLEYDHALNYLNIQLMRFNDRIVAEIAVLPTEYASAAVPRLILQPIFENILEHGINNISSDGLVQLHFLPEGDQLRIVIEDNGDQLKDETLTLLQTRLSSETPIQETSGLCNIHKRLQIYFGKDCGLRVARSELGGLRVDIVIKIQEENAL